MTKFPEGGYKGPRGGGDPVPGDPSKDRRSSVGRPVPTVSAVPTRDAQASPYRPPTPDFIRPTQSGSGKVDGTNMQSELLGGPRQVRVDRIEVPTSAATAAKEVSQAGDATGNYRTLSGESSWTGMRDVGPNGEVKITYVMDEAVAPRRGVITSPVTDADRKVAAAYVHHVSVTQTRLTPSELAKKLKEQEEQTRVPQAQSVDGVVADFLYNYTGNSVAVGVRATAVPEDELRKARLDASMKIGHAENYPTADNVRKGKEAEVVHDMTSKSLDRESTVTVTTLVVSGKTPQDAMAGAQALTASPIRPDYPFKLTVDGYHTDLAAAHASAQGRLVSNPKGWQSEKDNGVVTRMPIEKEHPGTPRGIERDTSPNSPDISAGTAKHGIGAITIGDGKEIQVPLGGTAVYEGVRGMGKSHALLLRMRSVLDADNSPEVRAMADGAGIRTTAIWVDMAKDSDPRRITEVVGRDVIPVIPGETGGDKTSVSLGIMEPTPGYPLASHWNDFIEVVAAQYASDHQSAGGEDTDMAVQAVKDSLRRVIFGTNTKKGLAGKVGQSIQLDRQMFAVGEATSFTTEELLDGVQKDILADRLHPGSSETGAHTTDYGDWMTRVLTNSNAGSLGVFLYDTDQTLDTISLLQQGVVTPLGLEGLSPGEKGVVTLAYLMRMRQAMYVLNKNRAAGEPAIRLDITADELPIALSSRVVRNYFDDLVRTGRSLGMRLDEGGVSGAFGAQDPRDLTPSLRVNSDTTVAFKLPDGALQKEVGDQFGLTDAGKAALSTLPQGNAIIQTHNQRNGVNTAVFQEFPTEGGGSIADIRPFVIINDAFEGPVRNEIREPALEFFLDPRGEKFRMNTHVAVGAYVDGDGHTEPVQRLKDQLNAYLDVHMRELRLPPAERAALRTKIQDYIVRMSIARTVRASATELLQSGIDPRVVTRRVTAWLPAVVRGENPNEDFDFGVSGESYFDAITHDGTFNPVRRWVESGITALTIASEHGIDLKAENGKTQLRMVDGIVHDEVTKRYVNLRGPLVDKKAAEGSNAPHVPDYDRTWKGTYGDIPGITVPDSDGRLAETVGEQLTYLQAWETRVTHDPSLLGGKKWEWVAAQRTKLINHIAATPPLPNEIRAQFETLYNEIIPGVSFAAGSAEEQLRVIDVQEAVWRQTLEDLGEYRPTDLAEILAPGTTGKTLLERAIIAEAQLAYPKWRGHLPFDRSAHTVQRYLADKNEDALAARIGEIIDESMVHPLGRARLAAVVSSLVKEVIEIRDGRSNT